MRHISFIIFIITGVLLSSCQKDHPNQIPVIEVISPFEGQEFSVPDTIHIEALITDDNNLKSIQVGLVNFQFTSVLPPIYLIPENNRFDLELDLPVTQSDIETGDYYVYIKAEDQQDFKNKYQLIHISGVPKVLEKIIVLTRKDATNINLAAIDPLGNAEPLFDITSDYSSSEINSKHRQIYIAGINLLDITVFNLDTWENDWQRAAFPPLPVHASDCFYFDEYLYASYASSYIYGFRYNGTQVFNASIEDGKLPSRIMKFDDFLFADLQSKTGGFSYIASYNISTGVEKQRLQTNYKLVDFHPTSQGEVLIIANENDEGVIWLFDPSSNTQSLLKEIPDEIICSVKLPNDSFLLGTSSAVYYLTINPLTLSEVFDSPEVFRLRFDELNQKIYAAGKNNIYFLSYPEIQIQNTIELFDSILNLHLLYNK